MVKYAFVLAGTNSGSGKTTITSGLMRLFSRKNMKVSPFKVGPDYIDPAFHQMAAGCVSHNLDTYLLSQKAVQNLFYQSSKDYEIAIVEGVMGLFDGVGMQSEGSTAELARMLNLPVILVVNCGSMYQSVGAIIKGFCVHDQSIKVKGVILNNVYNTDQYNFLKNYIETHCNVSCLGFLPPSPSISLESRHLGLVQAVENHELFNKVDRIADYLEIHLDIHKLLEISIFSNVSPVIDNKDEVPKKLLDNLRIAVAYDCAFSFYYQANFDLLRTQGADLIFFSPINDIKLPTNIDALYLGGGYPEVFAKELASNLSMRECVKSFAEQGMPIYAECGGLMYLTEGLCDSENTFYPMCAVFNCFSEMTPHLQNFGYSTVHWKSVSTRAHEFHHSRLNEQINRNYKNEFEIISCDGNRQWSGGLVRENVLATYSHIHFLSDFSFFKELCKLLSSSCL